MLVGSRWAQGGWRDTARPSGRATASIPTIRLGCGRAVGQANAASAEDRGRDAAEAPHRFPATSGHPCGSGAQT
jgi:hypothetical protein